MNGYSYDSFPTTWFVFHCVICPEGHRWLAMSLMDFYWHTLEHASRCDRLY